MPLPTPAPCCTSTSCRADTSACTAAGIMPTRYSLSLTSFGTPIRTLFAPRLGGAARLRVLVGLHLDLTLEERALGDHHPRRGDVSLDAAGGADLDALGGGDVAGHLAADPHHPAMERTAHRAPRADHHQRIDVDVAGDLAFDLEIGRAAHLALDPGAGGDKGRRRATPLPGRGIAGNAAGGRRGGGGKPWRWGTAEDRHVLRHPPKAG